jgi:hypothetical protein
LSPISAALNAQDLSIARAQGKMGFTMSEMTLEMALKSANSDDRRPATPTVALDRSYGEIGISAVAAAVRYQGTGKNPAYAPAAVK